MNRNLPVWILVLRGLLAVIFGILAITWPGLTVVALALLFGAFALVDGVGLIIGAFRRGRDTGQRIAYILGGVLGVAAGLVTLFWPGITALVLAIMVGAWAVVTGVADLWFASRVRGAWLIAVIGVLSIIAGVLILIRPDAGALAIATVIGIYAIVAGVAMFVAAWMLHRERSALAPDRSGVRHA
jgi:uncharacterized membrane protein HdeD (DUF308 family)